VTDDTHDESNWPTGVTRLLDQARFDVNEVLAGVAVSKALQLKEATGLPFETRQFPMYFGGDFKAPLVVVHLNPKASDQMDNPGFTNFEDYVDGHRRFGHLHWELDPKYYSPFDLKQIRFLKSFGAIDFLPSTDPRAARTNPARVIDQKLQLELVPYASPDFPAKRFSMEYLAPHFERVLGAIAAFPRKYVLLCGAVFDDLLQLSGREVDREDHHFRVTTKRGESKSDYRFSNVTIAHAGGTIDAGVARSFAIQGIPMDAYGVMCHELYQSLSTTRYSN
jgi:hypothetical protein